MADGTALYEGRLRRCGCWRCRGTSEPSDCGAARLLRYVRDDLSGL